MCAQGDKVAAAQVLQTREALLKASDSAESKRELQNLRKTIQTMGSGAAPGPKA